MKESNKYRQVLYIIFFAIMIFYVPEASAQSKGDSLKTFFYNISQKYLNQPELSYHVKYTYANETAPEMILDSMSATVLVKGKKYYYAADSTQIFSNDSISIMLFKENKIMYLSKAKSFSKYDPTAMFDSLVKEQKINFTIHDFAGESIADISFQESSQYKKVIISVNAGTGLIDTIKYIVKTEQLMEDGNKPDDVKRYGLYALVQATFEEDKEYDVNLLNFDPSEFFKNEDGKIVSVGMYKNYTVYLGTLGFK